MGTIEINSKQLEEIIEQAREGIVQATIEEVKRDINWTVKDAVGKEVTAIVREYVKTEIVPEISAVLVGQKAEILAGVVAGARIVGARLGEVIAEQALENLGERSYRRKEIVEKLFQR